MSDDRTFERKARAWLELGPTEAPERAVEAALLAIETTPQRRDLSVPWKGFPMTNPLRLATAAVVIGLLAIGGSFLLLGGQPSLVGTHPSPTIPASPSPNVGLAPSEIRAHWAAVGRRGAPEAIFEHGQDLVIGPTNVSINTFHGPVDSSLSFVGPDNRIALRLDTAQVRLDSEHWPCQPGQQGTYAFQLSSDGQTLRLTPMSDACSARSGILFGDWSRSPCRENGCEVALEPGQHVAANFGSGGFNTRILTRFAFTVPSGWSATSDVLNVYVLHPNDPSGGTLSVYLDVVPHSQDPSCRDAAEPGVGRTVADMASWLTSLPGIRSSAPTPITIGHYEGTIVDISVASRWTATCPHLAGPAVATFTSLQGDFRTYLDGGEGARYILLDLGNGHNLLIEGKVFFATSQSDPFPAADPIIQSFQIETNAP